MKNITSSNSYGKAKIIPDLTDYQALTPPKIMLFDWDDTLINTWPSLWRLYVESFEKQGANISDFISEEACRAYCIRHGKGLFEELLGEEKGVKARHFFLTQYAHTFMAHPAPFEGAEAVLKMFQNAGIPCGVVSNKSTDYISHEMKALGWEHYFNIIVGKDIVGTKPSPKSIFYAVEKINNALSDAGIFTESSGDAHGGATLTAPGGAAGIEAIQPQDIWFIGDSIVDAQTAIAAQCHFVAFGEMSPEYMNLPRVAYEERPKMPPKHHGDTDLTYRPDAFGVINWNQFEKILENTLTVPSSSLSNGATS